MSPPGLTIRASPEIMQPVITTRGIPRQPISGMADRLMMRRVLSKVAKRGDNDHGSETGGKSR
jgi:hypothetical protein